MRSICFSRFDGAELQRRYASVALLGALLAAGCSDSDAPTATHQGPAKSSESPDDTDADDDEADDDDVNDDDDGASTNTKRDAAVVRPLDAGKVALPDAGKTSAKPDGGMGQAPTTSVQDSAIAGGDAAVDEPSGDAAVVSKGSRPPCLKKPSQVIAMGDSYVGAPVVLIPKIEALAIKDGALKSGEKYRDYGAPGTTMGSPKAPGSIPPQWAAAKRADPDIKTIIMDGGGNDIIGSVVCLADGSHMQSNCIEIVKGVMDMTKQLANEAAAAGVTDVVYFLYPHVPLGGNDILDYSVDVGKKMCDELTTDKFRCHLVDTRAAFDGHPEYFGIDPIHANETGAKKIAELVWETMKSKCIAQPESSGCCEP